MNSHARRRACAQRLGQRVDELVLEGRPGAALFYWMTTIMGLPVEVVAPMRETPFWSAMEPMAHLLVRDAALLSDFSLPAKRLATVTVPTLVLDGGGIPWVSRGVRPLAEVLPNAEHRTLAGQPHNIPMTVLVPAIVDFLAH